MVAYLIDALRPEPARPLQAHETRSDEGGIVTAADPWTRFLRFLIAGVKGGTYYAGERDLAGEFVDVVQECLDLDGPRAVSTIVVVSKEGRAPSNEPAVLALMMALRHPDLETRHLAGSHFNEVVRTGTHLLNAYAYVRALGPPKPEGWQNEGQGPAVLRNAVHRKAFMRWFTSKSADGLAYQSVKYQRRGDVRMTDVLRQAHPKSKDAALNAVMKWINDGTERAYEPTTFTPGLLIARDALHREPSVAAAVRAITKFNLPREAIPTELLDEPAVWEALLFGMPMTAMLRNLGKMTAIGLLTDDLTNARTLHVVTQLTDSRKLEKARVHPIALLAALRVYEQGHGARGGLKWKPSKRIVNALDAAFYAAFRFVVPSNARLRVSVDVSSSMRQTVVNGMPFLLARDAAAALALVIAATEPNAEIIGFADRLYELPIRPSMRLDEVMRITTSFPAGWTFCSLPILEASQTGHRFDAFVSLTDGQTADGMRGMGVPGLPFADALARYREQMGAPVRHIAAAMAANAFSLAHPDDPHSLDIAGFDPSTPAVVSFFASTMNTSNMKM